MTRLLGGRYELGDVIGRGGMADVHSGYDTRLSRPVAIKLLRPDLARDGNFLVRFRREAQAAAQLNHPSIVAIFDSGDDEGVDAHGNPTRVPYIVMEMVRGRTLRERHWLTATRWASSTATSSPATSCSPRPARSRSWTSASPARSPTLRRR